MITRSFIRFPGTEAAGENVMDQKNHGVGLSPVTAATQWLVFDGEEGLGWIGELR
jgi:hypothetical protein